MENKNENLAQKIERLTAELDAAKKQVAECGHVFSKPTCVTKEVNEPIFDHYEGHGSDPEPVYRFVPRTEYGWEQICEKCGYREYTTSTKPVISGYVPDFKR